MKLLRCLPLLLLAHCAGSLPPVASAACELRKAAEIAVTFEQGLISAPATIDDQPVTMLIDTGAESSLVTPAAMAVLHLRPDTARRTTILGTGGAITTQNAWLQSVGIAGMDVRQQSAAVAPLPASRGAPMQASGLLGADLLSDFDVEFDLPHRRIALYRVEGCSGDYVPWDGPKHALRAQSYGRGLLLLPVTIDGQTVTALLDSGANRSSLADTVAERVGAGAQAGDRAGQVVGMDGAVRPAHQHRFGQMGVGAAHYADTLIGIGPLHLPMADMLLGADWLRRNRVWISYATRRVTIQPDQPGILVAGGPG